ncbi:hypothetical protein [Actinokineospora sp.]|uniref:hypothetical protein n=1 Tax=Actinokineospora sp. TaxID=1872133 RepID=UPI004037F05A
MTVLVSFAALVRIAFWLTVVGIVLGVSLARGGDPAGADGVPMVTEAACVHSTAGAEATALCGRT